MPDSSRHEATLIECAVAGEADAFGELYYIPNARTNRMANTVRAGNAP